MRKIGFILGLVILTSNAFGQQSLWSTQNDSSNKYVALDNVADKVLEYYDFYQFYNDGTCYSKDGVLKALENSESSQNSDTSLWVALKERIIALDSLTVFAFKTNSGTGSEIMIMCVNDKNVDMLVFNNSIESGVVRAGDYKREKFQKWFKTLLI